MISINRALSELKLLNKKIASKTDSLDAAAGVKGIASEQKDNFIKDSKAKVQQIRDLIARRDLIKSSIVASNAQTMVAVAGKSMTVAEAIERKTSIDLTKNLNRKVRESYYSAKAGVENHNEEVKRNADKQAEAALGADTEGDKGAGYKAIVDAYIERNKAELIAYEGIEQEIEKTQDEIDEFESEVDFILSESNTKTMIDV